MLQAVDAFDGKSAGGADFVYLKCGMGVALQDEFGGTFDGLGHHLHAVLGIDAQLDAHLHDCLDVLQGIGNAARGHGRGSSKLFFGQQHGQSHFVEDVEHQLLLFGTGVGTGNECHALHLADGGVGYQAEDGHLRTSKQVPDFAQTDAGGDGDEHLLFVQLDSAEHVVYQPGFDGQQHDVGLAGSLAVVAGGADVGIVGLQGF